MIKDGFEDYQRKKSDDEENNRLADCIPLPLNKSSKAASKSAKNSNADTSNTLETTTDGNLESNISSTLILPQEEMAA